MHSLYLVNIKSSIFIYFNFDNEKSTFILQSKNISAAVINKILKKILYKNEEFLSISSIDT